MRFLTWKSDLSITHLQRICVTLSLKMVCLVLEKYVLIIFIVKLLVKIAGE